MKIASNNLFAYHDVYHLTMIVGSMTHIKLLVIISMLFIWRFSYSQFGLILERDYNEEYFNIGLLITSNNEKHVIGASRSIVFGPSGIDSYKFGCGYMLDKNSYPFIELAYGRRKEFQQKKINLTIGYTFKGIHLGYDFRDGIKMGYYLLFFREKD